jgi:serine/threonine-protein kinase RsbT
MTAELTATIVPIHGETDVILARQAGRTLAQRLGFSAVDQARITTAISELARNIVIYGVRGAVSLREVTNGEGARGVEILFDDEGPGIADIPQAMEQGVSSGRGLGAGLPGTRRLMDEFEIRSTPGEGLHIVTRKWR